MSLKLQIPIQQKYKATVHQFYTFRESSNISEPLTLTQYQPIEVMNIGKSNVNIYGDLNITGDILPSSCNVYDLGSSNYRWRDLYLSGNTIDLGGTLISRDNITGGVTITSKIDNSPLDFSAKNIYTTGTIGIGTDISLQALDVRGHIYTSGNIGIGTDIPSHALDVRGHIYTSGTIICSNISVIGDFVTMNTITSNTEQMVIINDGTGPALKVTQSGNNTVAEFYDKESGTALFIANNGNVGIGTTANNVRLNVNGSISTNNNNINAGTGSVTAASFLGSATQVSQTLTRGTYLTGNNYNGSSATTWAVDATSANTANKIVARDGNGDFSTNATTMVTNNITGNIQIGDSSIDTNMLLRMSKQNINVATAGLFRGQYINITSSSAGPTGFNNVIGFEFQLTNNAVDNRPTGYTYFTAASFSLDNYQHLQNAYALKPTVNANSGSTTDNIDVSYNTINAIGTVNNANITTNRILTIQNAAVTNCYTQRNEVYVLDTSTITNCYGSYTQVSTSTNPIQNAYGNYINFDGLVSTNPSYGLYFTGEKRNYISGNIGIGNTNPTQKLDVVGNIKASGNVFKNFIGCHVRNCQNVTSGSTTILIFGTVDTTSGHYSTSTGKFTCPVAGYYHIISSTLNTAVGANRTGIYQNTTKITIDGWSLPNEYCTCTISAIANCTAGQTLHTQALYTQGGYCSMTIHFIG